MADTESQESQQELFTQFSSAEGKKPDRFPTLHRSPKPILVTTSVEQMILAGIILILSACFVFFMGVLRGKAIASGETPPVRIASPVPARETVPAQPPAPPAPAAPARGETPSPPASRPEPKEEVSGTSVAPGSALDVSKPYTIQLITYKKKDQAEQEMVSLKKKGYYSSIISSGDYYQVCVGQYANKEEALRDLKLFGAKYKDCFLRRR